MPFSLIALRCSILPTLLSDLRESATPDSRRQTGLNMSTLRPRLASTCQHPNLRFKASNHGNEVGYRRLTDQQRATAAGKKRVSEVESENLFPAPLVQPGDELSFDPRYPPQSLRSWIGEKERNELTRKRNVLYVAGPPALSGGVEFVRKWTAPQGKGKEVDANLAQPRLQDVVDYLAAFYHGVEVRILPPDVLRFAQWEGDKGRRAKTKPRFIGLNTTTESIGIRVRPSPDGVFQGQLDLDHLLDTAISVLPDDAYALLMLVEHDLFEDEDDDFCCGRAYGGSRVAMVSMARYNPDLDASQSVERQHAWPASHCEAYMQRFCDDHSKPAKGPLKKSFEQIASAPADSSPDNATPLQAAVTAHKAQAQPNLSSIWLSRVCQTASHELGHCFGMDHCVYYACVMQGTSCLAEDVRQPPYLCPVDLAKVLRATGASEKGRYEALRSFCTAHAHVPMFAAFEAWLGSMLGKHNESPQSSQNKLGSEEEPIEL